MIKKLPVVFLFLVLSFSCRSQEKYRYLSIGVNPLSLVESQMSLGPCVAYRFSKRTEVWSEASFIFANLYMPRQWTNMSGFRFIIQPRYFFNQYQSFFVAPEFRVKNYTFNNTLSFLNPVTHDTIHNANFRERQFLIGGALVFGRQYQLSKKNNLILEFTFGIGGRQRNITRRNIPAGYDHINTKGYALSPSYENDKEGIVYVPLGARFIWKLNYN